MDCSAEENETNFNDMAMSALLDAGLTEDEAERELEDYQFNY